MEITLYENTFNTKPINLKVGWAELCEMAGDYFLTRAKRSEKLYHPAMTFGRCENARKAANVRFHSGIAADFDTKPSSNRYITFANICDQLEAKGVAFIGYTTTNNSAGHNKFRLIMPYEHDVEFAQCRAAWHVCDVKFDGAIDQSTHNEDRLSFMPADWIENPYRVKVRGQPDKTVTLTDAFNAFRVNVGGKPILSAGEIAGLSVGKFSNSGSSSSVPVSNAEMLKLGMGKDAEAPIWNLIVPEDFRSSIVVQRWMYEKLPQEEGNREYRFMRAVAEYAVSNKIPIRAEAIEVLADCFSRECLGREGCLDGERQAENALKWAIRNSASDAGPSQPDADIQP